MFEFGQIVDVGHSTSKFGKESVFAYYYNFVQVDKLIMYIVMCINAECMNVYINLTEKSDFIMATLWNRAGHYNFALWFLSFFAFPRLFSAVGDWMSTILLHMVWH